MLLSAPVRLFTASLFAIGIAELRLDRQPTSGEAAPRPMQNELQAMKNELHPMRNLWCWKQKDSLPKRNSESKSTLSGCELAVPGLPPGCV